MSTKTIDQIYFNASGPKDAYSKRLARGWIVGMPQARDNAERVRENGLGVEHGRFRPIDRALPLRPHASFTGLKPWMRTLRDARRPYPTALIT